MKTIILITGLAMSLCSAAMAGNGDTDGCREKNKKELIAIAKSSGIKEFYLEKLDPNIFPGAEQSLKGTFIDENGMPAYIEVVYENYGCNMISGLGHAANPKLYELVEVK